MVTAAEAVERALRHIGKGTYALGAGDYHPEKPDSPWTSKPPSYNYGCDCWGYAHSYCYKTPRHRPGFNKGPWATVADDINTDSAIEQAEHPQATDRLFEVVDTPRIGDLVVYPSVREGAIVKASKAPHKRLRIGHVGIIVGVPAEWDPAMPQFGMLTVVQCQAARSPAVIKGPGTGWMGREGFRGFVDSAWRSRILRVTGA